MCKEKQPVPMLSVRSSMFSVESLMFDDVRSVAGAGVFSDELK